MYTSHSECFQYFSQCINMNLNCFYFLLADKRLLFELANFVFIKPEIGKQGQVIFDTQSTVMMIELIKWCI